MAVATRVNGQGTPFLVVPPADLAEFIEQVTGPRSLAAIAADIRASWPNVYFAAVPYLEAMGRLDKITDSYGYDTAEEIVIRFLGNARTWRGEDAKRIKAELRGLLK